MPERFPVEVGLGVYNASHIEAAVIELDGSVGAGAPFVASTVEEIQTGQKFLRITVAVTVIFDGVPTLILGNSANDDLLVTLANAVNLAALGVTVLLIPQAVDWDIDSVLVASVGGAPTVGTAIILAENALVPTV